MRVSRVLTSARLVATDLARNRPAMAMLLLIPVAFYALVAATTGNRDVVFQLAAADRELVTASERHVALLFIGLVSISGLSAFLAFVLVLRPRGADHRLVFEGFRPAELLAAKTGVLIGVAVVVASYVMAMLPLLFRAARPAGVFAGFIGASLIYAAIGMAIAALVRRELEGILFILLLVNIDAGWLQSPVFYAHAHNQDIIRLLPSHHPAQLVMMSAFSGAPVRAAAVSSAAYLAGCLGIAALGYWLRVRVRR